MNNAPGTTPLCRISLAAVACLLAVCLIHSLPAADIVSEMDVAVPMRDGTILRANVFRPRDGGPFPVLVMRTPYGKPAQVDESFIRLGFIVVTQDTRGRYASDGKFESFVRPETHDAADGHDTIEWAAKLPNCNGKVGLYGTSYPAFLAWRAAGQKPKALTAMAAFSIPATYTDLESPGAIRPGRRLKWWQGTISPDLRKKSGGSPPYTSAEAAKSWDSGDGEKLLLQLPRSALPDEIFGTESPFVKSWLKEPWRDPWQLEKDARSTIVPNLNVCGWYDHCNGSIDLHQAIARDGGSFIAKRFSKLIVGPWGHNSLGKRRQGEIDFGPSAEINLLELQQEWFAHWLRGEKKGIDHRAPIRLFVMGANEWRDYYDWPPRTSKPRKWSLESDGTANTPHGSGRLVLDKTATGAESDSYNYDPRNPVPTLWTPALFTVPADQKPLAARQDILVYQTPLLTEHVETIGYPEVVLLASSSGPDTDFFVRLIDVAPDGRAIDVASGMVRARYRESLDNGKLLQPGEVTEFHIRMRPTAHRFLAGHRMRLDVTSSDFPNYDRNHNTSADQNADSELVTARQVVYHSTAYRSQLILPVMRDKELGPEWAEQAKLQPPEFVKEWGKEGDAAGEFHSPIGIAIDSQDRIYVTEFHNSRVQVFDADGNSLRTIPVPDKPGGIAVDKQGRIYVALMITGKICVYDSEGKPLREWGKVGAADGEFNQPGGIAIAPDDSVCVVDQANHRLQFFFPEGTLLRKFGEYGNEPGQFGGAGPKGSRLSGPHFAAFGPDGRLFVTEGANARIQSFDSLGNPVNAWADKTEGPGGFGGRPDDRTNPFTGPIGIIVDRHGRIWVTATNNRLQCFSADGKFLTGLGQEGTGPGEFVIPHGMAIDSHDFLYVVDASNHRVQKFRLP